jgi:hypothetical protein
MAHFAKINSNNIIESVLVLDNAELNGLEFPESEALGVAFFKTLLGEDTNWKQTSYNANFRKNYAGIDYTYDSQRDAFIPPQPYPSWTLVEETCNWTAPVLYPTDGNQYQWDEATTNWVQVNKETP